MTQRYIVAYGDMYGSKCPYCLWDTKDKLVRFASESKSEVIAVSQRFNKFEPIDGDEQTYGKQVKG